MASDDEQSPLEVTPQQSYYAQRYYLERHGTPEQVAEFSAAGPPPPEQADGVTGKVLYYEANTPSADDIAALLVEMEQAGWITSTIRATLAELPPEDGVAELKARMVEPDSDRRQPGPGAGDPA
ncbi:hypothetical protein F5X71_00495 [Nocardia brasiliensis]|uniref:Uncharacterized protein n=1 Tax=Nocardia brasiliensis TaxID=37326 RepID=A0A6G9XJC0_NOCBR|nr:hypothetical protein [Nocardia brasiliensis]QIS01009.1 hypothetical protein F5X71_00495 [Nocardia brasiliensis]